MDKHYINLGAVKTKEIDGELYISCWNFSKALNEKEREISDLCKENDELEKKISELESELEHSKEYTEALRRTLGLRPAKENIELANKLYGLNFEVPSKEEPLPFSSDEYEECLEEELEDLRNRHQQGCITISQLQTTIDTLVDRYAKLRKERGL